ncbi:protein YhfH [Bacillus kwashiorkori]|nr:protein YhfH [Bacillus kwashiorkori]
MLMKMSEFLKVLPPKLCYICGERIEEQHECYGNKCHKCLGFKDL